MPLRQLARDKDTAIIPLYEAQRLFGNIGEVLGANSAFVKDLESFMKDRKNEKETAGLGDLVYRHISCFSCYNEYFNNFEKAKHIEQTMTKSNRAFREFVDRTKSSTFGLGNVGLRELIMEPVQRIPRYTMLLDGMVRNLATSDSTRSRLEEAIVLASRIANCEVDDKTKRAAVHWSLARNIDGFPAGLISVHRQFIDCIDVDDFPIDVLGPAAMNGMLSPGGSASLSSPNNRMLHCTLFLFHDVIAIVKRASASSCGRFLVGLEDLNRLADQMKTFTEKSTSASRTNQKVELGFRGLIDITNVQVLDLGGSDFQISFAKGPSHISGEKWASRLIRQYATIDASSTSGPDPALARSEKQRFMENLWRAQALFKAKEFRSHVRNCVIPSSIGEERIRRVIYWNIYSRRPYLIEPNKSMTVLHVDPEDQADVLPFGFENAPPGAIVRIHELDKETGQCSFSLSIKQSGKVAEEGVRDVQTISLADLATQLYKVAKQAGHHTMSDFEPRSNSPSTPASSHRGRNLATGLEQFGRSLFGTPNSMRSTGTGSDLFGTRRSKGSSSNFSRAASVSTRITQSTANTSSIGSRDMLRSSRLDVPCNDGTKQNIQRYREMTSPDPEMTPRKGDQESVSPPVNDKETSLSPSPIRQKPVPGMMPSSPQRVPSASKRTLPLDATPTEKPCKRVASGRKNQPEEQDKMLRSVSPSPSRRPIGPRGASVSVNNNTSVAPLRVRKDNNQQTRQLTRQERIQSIWKDLESLRQGIVTSREVLQHLQFQANVVIEDLEDCSVGQENNAEVLLRLRDNLNVLLDESISKKEIKAKETSSDDLVIIQKLQTQVSCLTRKCELLSALEKDGRLENTELHKAFNEELDQMYEDAALGEVEQIAKLRAEVKRAKGQRNEANIENK